MDQRGSVSPPDRKQASTDDRKNASKLLKKLRRSRGASASPKSAASVDGDGHARSALAVRNEVPSPIDAASRAVVGEPSTPGSGGEVVASTPVSGERRRSRKSSPSSVTPSPAEFKKLRARFNKKAEKLKATQDSSSQPNSPAGVEGLTISDTDTAQGGSPAVGSPLVPSDAAVHRTTPGPSTPGVAPSPAAAGPTSADSTPSKSPAELKKLRAKFAKKGRKKKQSMEPTSATASPLGPPSMQATPVVDRRVPGEDGDSAPSSTDPSHAASTEDAGEPPRTVGGTLFDDIDGQELESYTKRMSDLISEREVQLLTPYSGREDDSAIGASPSGVIAAAVAAREADEVLQAKVAELKAKVRAQKDRMEEERRVADAALAAAVASASIAARDEANDASQKQIVGLQSVQQRLEAEARMQATQMEEERRAAEATRAAAITSACVAARDEATAAAQEQIVELKSVQQRLEAEALIQRAQLEEERRAAAATQTAAVASAAAAANVIADATAQETVSELETARQHLEADVRMQTTQMEEERRAAENERGILGERIVGLEQNLANAQEGIEGAAEITAQVEQAAAVAAEAYRAELLRRDKANADLIADSEAAELALAAQHAESIQELQAQVAMGARALESFRAEAGGDADALQSQQLEFDRQREETAARVRTKTAALTAQLAEAEKEADALRAAHDDLTGDVLDRETELRRVQSAAAARDADNEVALAMLRQTVATMEEDKDSVAAALKQTIDDGEARLQAAVFAEQAVAQDLLKKAAELQDVAAASADSDDTVATLTARVVELEQAVEMSSRELTAERDAAAALTMRTATEPQPLSAGDAVALTSTPSAKPHGLVIGTDGALSPVFAPLDTAPTTHSPEVQKLVTRALDTQDPSLINELGKVAVQLAADYEKVQKNLRSQNVKLSVQALREGLVAQEEEMAKLRSEIALSEQECDHLIGIRESQDSLLSNHDEEISVLSTSMLDESEGEEMHLRTNEVRNARVIVERQRLRLKQLRDSERTAIESATALEATVNNLQRQLEGAKEGGSAREVALQTIVAGLERDLADATETLADQDESLQQYKARADSAEARLWAAIVAAEATDRSDALQHHAARADAAEARVAAIAAEITAVTEREQGSAVAATEANARVTVLERELQELTRRKVRQEMEATAREKSATDALDVAESRVATLEHHRRESSPAVAAKAAEIERLKIELEIASKSKGRLETVEANLKTALAEAKEAAEAAETARDVAVHKGRADVDVLKIRVVSLQEESTSASTKIEMLKTLLDNQNNELEKMEAFFKHQTEQYEDRVEWLEGQLKMATAESEDAHRELGVQRGRVEAANEAADNHMAELHSSQHTVASLQTQLAAKQKLAANAESRATRAEADLQKTGQQLLTTSGELESLSSVHQTATNRQASVEAGRREAAAMVVAFESRVTSLEQQLKTAKSKVESATNAVEQAQKKAEAAVTAAATDRASRDAALAEADAAREEAEQAVAERSQLLATVEREKVAEIARRAADVEKFREVQTTKDKRFEEALERKQLGFDHRVEQLITSHRQEIVTFETRVTEMRLTLEERNKTSRASQEELQKGELLIRQVQLAAVAREEELVEQLSTTNSAANAIREELQAALDRADQHTLQMMELNAAYEVARAEFDDRTRVLKVDIAELNEQLFETMSAGELAASRAKAAESQLTTLRELVAAGQSQREAADRALEAVRRDLIDEKRRANTAETYANSAEAKVVELEMAFAESKQQHTSVVDELDRVRDKEASQRITLESLVIEVAQLTTSHKELTEVNEELQHTLERHKATSSATMAQKICAEQERESAVSDADSLREKNAAYAEENAETQTELARMGEQLKRLHGSLAELLAERDHYAAEAADAESKRSDLEQEVLRFRTVFMWHTAYGAKAAAHGGPQLVERADMLEKHLATAIAEKSRVEAELTETRGAAVASLKQHKQRRAAFMWRHLSWRAQKKAETVAATRRVTTVHREELDALEVRAMDAESSLATVQQLAATRAETMSRLEADYRNASARVRALEFEKGQMANELLLEKVKVTSQAAERQSSAAVDQAVRNLNAVVRELSGELAETKSQLHQMETDNAALLSEKSTVAEKMIRLEHSNASSLSNSFERSQIETRSSLLEADNKRLHVRLHQARRDARSTTPGGSPSSVTTSPPTANSTASKGSAEKPHTGGSTMPSPLTWDNPEAPRHMPSSHAVKAAFMSPHGSSSKAQQDARRAAFIRDVDVSWGDNRASLSPKVSESPSNSSPTIEHANSGDVSTRVVEEVLEMRIIEESLVQVGTETVEGSAEE